MGRRLRSQFQHAYTARGWAARGGVPMVSIDGTGRNLALCRKQAMHATVAGRTVGRRFKVSQSSEGHVRRVQGRRLPRWQFFIKYSSGLSSPSAQAQDSSMMDLRLARLLFMSRWYISATKGSASLPKKPPRVSVEPSCLTSVDPP